MNTENENNYKQSGLCFCPVCKTIVPVHQAIDHTNKSESGLCERLMNLPNIKAKPDFEQKMSALFALELDNEVHRINQAWLRKSRKIRLPNIISDLSSELF